MTSSILLQLWTSSYMSCSSEMRHWRQPSRRAELGRREVGDLAAHGEHYINT